MSLITSPSLPVFGKKSVCGEGEFTVSVNNQNPGERVREPGGNTCPQKHQSIHSALV